MSAPTTGEMLERGLGLGWTYDSPPDDLNAADRTALLETMDLCEEHGMGGRLRCRGAKDQDADELEAKIKLRRDADLLGVVEEIRVEAALMAVVGAGEVDSMISWALGHGQQEVAQTIDSISRHRRVGRNLVPGCGQDLRATIARGSVDEFGEGMATCPNCSLEISFARRVVDAS